MKYSFFCKNCGDYFSSDDREKVENYRKYHRISAGYWGGKHCPLQLTKNGTLARPFLARMIDGEEI